MLVLTRKLTEVGIALLGQARMRIAGAGYWGTLACAAFCLVSCLASSGASAQTPSSSAAQASRVKAGSVKAIPIKANPTAVMTGTPPPAATAPPHMPLSDLLASVRAHMARLRAAPVTGPSSKIQENDARRAANQVKVLHDWNGDTKEVTWPFTLKK